ncbi:LOW QUALITY PROTEIN: UBX domain-containing protein 7-like [Ptychodera flava]|uniref:LOW QUALITY PROTEIN: UBX domain-containing protein 7-like n=1 Tax=Ptychodera flava TaxID=63121 RepID=UPI00396A2C93
MASKSKAFKKLAEQFTAITGASEEVGRRMLEVCNGNLEMAIGMHLEGQADSVTETSDSDGANIASTSAAVTNDEESVRAPIPQKRDILVEGGYAFGPRPRKRGGRGSVFDRFRDFQAEARAQEERMKNLAEGKPVSKKKTLEDLFRPPIDIMHKGTFDTARETGQNQCKWVLVNVQNVQEFSCQKLNRDVWSSPAVKSIIEEHFVFWQVYHDSDEGQKYIQFYKITEFPYVAVIDPRTGEKLLEWHKVDSLSFCDLATEFLSSHPIFDKDGLSPPPKKKVRRSESIVDASEDSQLEAAIAASLAESKTEDTKEKRKETKKHTKQHPQFFYGNDSDDDSETFHSINGSCSESDCSDDEDFATGLSSSHSSPTKKIENGNSEHTLRAGKLKESRGLVERLDEKSERNELSCRTENGNKSNNKSNTGESNEKCDTVKEQVIVNDDSVESEDEASESEDQNSQDVTNSEKSEEDESVDDNGPKAKLMIRFPDGKRKQLSLPASAKLMTLVKLVISEGYSNERFELVTNFPRRKLSYLDFDTTLQDAGLFPQETVFVQER